MYGKSWSEESKEKVGKFMRSEKNPNRGKKRSFDSKYNGVIKYKKTDKWKSHYRNSNNELIQLGYFFTEIEAAMAYNEAMLEEYGWKAKGLNVFSKEEIYEIWNLEFENKENKGSSKLTNENVIEIRQLLFEGKLKEKEIAEKFNVCRKTVNNIKNNKIWKDVK